MNTLKKYLSKIKYFDILGQDFQVKFDTRDRLSSRTGGCISLVAIIFTFLAILLYLYEYLDWTNPEVIITTESQSPYPKYDLYSSEYLFLINFSRNGLSIPLEKVLNIFEISVWRSSIVMGEDGHSVMENVLYSLQKCSEVDKKIMISKGFFKNNFKHYVLESSLCLNITEPEEYYVQNRYIDLPYRSLEVAVFPCSITTNPNCRAADDDVNDIELIFGQSEYTFEPSNFLYPIKQVPNTDIKYKLHKRSQIYGGSEFRKNILKDSKLDFIDTSDRLYYFDFERSSVLSRARDPLESNCQQQILANVHRVNNCTSYFEFSIRSGGTTRIIERRYTKLVDTLGNMGGIFEISIFLGILIFTCCSDSFFDSYLRTVYFGDSSKELESLFWNQSPKQLNSKVNQLISDQSELSRVINALNTSQILSYAILEPYHVVLTPLLLLIKSKDTQRAASEYNQIDCAGNILNKKTLIEAFRSLEESRKTRTGAQRQIDDYYYAELKILIDGSRDSGKIATTFKKEVLDPGVQKEKLVESVSQQQINTPQNENINMKLYVQAKSSRRVGKKSTKLIKHI